MGGTWEVHFRELSERVGNGTLKGQVVVDQVYAHYQHEHPEFRHPDGGKAFYLRDPLFDNHEEYLREVAEKVIDENPKHAMASAMEKLSNEVYQNAPWEFGDLRASGNPRVYDDGNEVYNRAPAVHRLDKEELRAKSEMRDLFDPHRYDY